MILVWGQYLLLLAGFSALGYCAIAIADATGYQAWARDQMRKASLVSAEPATTRSSAGISQPAPLRLGSEMDLVGRIDVPRLHISAMVAEGASSRILRVAVGHIPGTALPGQAGNVALAAHRDTFFRHLARNARQAEGVMRAGELRLTDEEVNEIETFVADKAA
ncbi:MAG: sortase [Candidatus Sulfotelmatobacter sp.]